MYRVTKVISAALLAFIIVTAVTVGLGSMADDGVILDAWYAMIGYIPFGNVLAPLCVDLFSESFNLGKNMSEYLIGIKALTMLDFFQDVVILLLTAVCFEAVNNFVQVLMGVKEKGGIYNVLLQMISGMVVAFHVCCIHYPECSLPAAGFPAQSGSGDYFGSRYPDHSKWGCWCPVFCTGNRTCRSNWICFSEDCSDKYIESCSHLYRNFAGAVVSE